MATQAAAAPAPAADSKTREVSADPNVLTGKTPLQHEWTYWHAAPSKTASGWSAGLTAVATFKTAEDFFLLEGAVSTPSAVAAASAEDQQLAIFRDELEPRWELDELRGGGRWIISASYVAGAEGQVHVRPLGVGPRDDAADADSDRVSIDTMWSRLQRLAVGGEVDLGGALAGVLVERRRKDLSPAPRDSRYRVAIWTTTTDEKTLLAMGTSIAVALELPAGSMEFNSFSRETDEEGKRRPKVTLQV